MKRIITLVAVLALMLATFSVPFSVAADDYLFCATRAIRISDTEIVVEFTKPVSADGLGHPFTAMRWMNMGTNGLPTGLAYDGTTPLQDEKSAWRFFSETDHTRIVFTFEKAVLDAYGETTGNANYDAGRRAYLVIEELSPATGHGHDTLYDVVSTDGSMLRASSTKTSGWDFVALAVEKNYDYTPVDSEPSSRLAGIIVHKPLTNITTLSGKKTSEISFVFHNAYAGDWMWGITLIPRNAETGNLEMPMYVNSLSWYNYDSGEEVLIDGVNQKVSWSYSKSSTDSNGDNLFTVLFQIPEAVLNAAGYETLEDAAKAGALIGYISEYTLDHLNTGYMDQNPQAGVFRANAYSSDGREAVVLKVLPEDEYYNPSSTTTAPDSDEPDDTTTAPDSDEPDETTTAPDSDEPDETTTAPDTTAPVDSEIPDAPSTADASSVLTSVAAAALIGCAALIVYKEKH